MNRKDIIKATIISAVIGVVAGMLGIKFVDDPVRYFMLTTPATIVLIALAIW